jgi:isopentenyl-diphosphate delta-isomerase
MEEVILVNTFDEQIGKLEKMAAHEQGLLHRAFSVLIFNDAGELLIHQRAHDKYHCAGLWTNTCCSHQREGESNEQAAFRRLQEEMGFAVAVQSIGSFVYHITFDNGLTEHELDHVLIGNYNGQPTPNPDEVADWKYISLEELEIQMKNNPEQFTFWFREIMHRFGADLKKKL